MRSHQPAHSRPSLPAGTRIVSAAGVELDGRAGVAEAVAEEINRRGARDGTITVASVRAEAPDDRTLRRDTPEANSALVA
jgi:hypothetical protein